MMLEYKLSLLRDDECLEDRFVFALFFRVIVWVFYLMLLILCDGESVESFAGWWNPSSAEALAVSDMQITPIKLRLTFLGKITILL
jgi:hypothetical protein